MAAPFPSSGRMDAWAQRRGLQTMNLRSVFTAEQQRTLERYYDNGMTNQSKACFQLILQCAQEAKLDFSVVRTWVGNKRRKLASKVEQNGAVSHSLPSHGLAGGLLSGHSLAGGPLSHHGLAAVAAAAAGHLLPADVAAARNIQNRVHLLPPSSSFPSFSSTSSSPSSSSPHSSGSNNNSGDVILTGIYSLNSVPRSQPRPPAPPPQSDFDVPAHTSPHLISRALQSRSSSASSPLPSKLVSLAQNLPPLTSASGPLVYTAVRKGALSVGEAGASAGEGAVPLSWTRQYGRVQTRPWSSSSLPQPQPQPGPHSNPQPQPAAPQKTRVTLSVQNSSPSSKQTPRIQQVFTLSEGSEGDTLRDSPARLGQGSTRKSQETAHSLDPSQNFSIAMETGNEEDEWQREEELASMATQTHLHREQTSSRQSEASLARREHTPPMTGTRTALLHGNTTLQGSYCVTAQTSLTGEPGSQTPLGVSAAPWVVSNSRKRTLQDRTQFSDADLIQLKRYWDRGMTSLGSVCREKINAAANQLNVDTEIVKTWISNRRRKYRLMGIEIPPPRGGPAVFSSSSPGNKSPAALSPDEAGLRTPELGDDLNDEGSLCLSEDYMDESQQRDEEDGIDVSTATALVNHVIEVIDEVGEYGDDEDDDLLASDLDQMQSMLEFKHEEVQFLEIELENQKQKYDELASFTKSLLSAVRTNDLERQQELMASLPQPSDQDWDTTGETGTDASCDHSGSPVAERPPAPSKQEVPLAPVHKEEPSTEVSEPSASEERLQEAVAEQK
ncbi:highly divergent homeobox isoform X2 [Gasterosteus aculeatus]